MRHFPPPHGRIASILIGLCLTLLASSGATAAGPNLAPTSLLQTQPTAAYAGLLADASLAPSPTTADRNMAMRYLSSINGRQITGWVFMGAGTLTGLSAIVMAYSDLDLDSATVAGIGGAAVGLVLIGGAVSGAAMHMARNANMMMGGTNMFPVLPIIGWVNFAAGLIMGTAASTLGGLDVIDGAFAGDLGTAALVSSILSVVCFQVDTMIHKGRLLRSTQAPAAVGDASPTFAPSGVVLKDGAVFGMSGSF
jgi:hypothetical protein